MTTSQLERYESSPNINSLTQRRPTRQLINRNANIINNHNIHRNDVNGWKFNRGRGRGRFSGSFNGGAAFGGHNYYRPANPFYLDPYPNLMALEVTVMTSDFFSQVRLPYSDVVQTLNLLFRPNNQNDSNTRL